jgi:hypothetical protein
MLHRLYMRIILITIAVSAMLASTHFPTNRLVCAHFYACECLLVSVCSPTVRLAKQVLTLIGGRGYAVLVNIVGASSAHEKQYVA